MKRRFSDDDILRFLYEEMEAQESDDFLTALCEDEELWARYERLQEGMELTLGLQFEPSDRSVEFVRNYVKATAGQIQVPEPEEKKTRVRPLWQRIPKDLPLKMVASIAIVLFLSVAITGSVYTLDGSRISVPVQDQLVQSAPEKDARFSWDDSDLDQRLEDIRAKMEQIQNKPI